MRKKTAEEIDFRIFLDELIEDDVKTFQEIVKEYDKIAGLEYIEGLVLALKNELEDEDYEYFKKRITTKT